MMCRLGHMFVQSFLDLVLIFLASTGTGKIHWEFTLRLESLLRSIRASYQNSHTCLNCPLICLVCIIGCN